MLDDAAAAMARVRLEQRAKAGASWFYWIAGLSLINSVAHATGSKWGLLAGLGITQVIDGFVSNGTTTLRAIGVLANLAAAAIFVALGFLARTQNAAFIAGMVIYSLDALIFLAAQEWLGLGFHIFVLLLISSGYAAFKLLRPPVPRPQATPVSPSTPPPQVRPEDLHFRS